jgi:hypothetical protein
MWRLVILPQGLTIANLGAKFYATCKTHGSLVGGCGFESAIRLEAKISLYIFIHNFAYVTSNNAQFCAGRKKMSLYKITQGTQKTILNRVLNKAHTKDFNVLSL